MCKVLPRAPNQMPVDVDYMNIYAETIWIMQVSNFLFFLFMGRILDSHVDEFNPFRDDL